MIVARVACLLLASIVVASCKGQEHGTHISIRGPAFSVDGDKVFLDYCANSVCDLVMYSIAERTVTMIRPMDGSLGFGRAGVGPGPGQIVATIYARDQAAKRETQVVVLNLPSNTYRLITSDASIKSSPNFSFDGQKLAYIQSHRDRTWFNGSPRATSWDLHTLDLTTGKTERITSYCFWGLGHPFFYPGSDDLVFHAEGPMCNYPSPDTVEAKGYLKYKDRFGENNIVRIGPSRTTLEPWIANGLHSSSPSVSKAGDVLFLSRTNEMDGIKKGDFNYDFFLRRGDSIRRLTQLKTMIMGSALSADGRFVAYLSDPERKQRVSLWIFDIERDSHQQIVLPELTESAVGQIPVRFMAEAEAKEPQR